MKKKKILVLNYEFPPLGGGASPVSKDMSVEFVRCGHEVTVITMGYHGLPAYEEIEGVKVYRLKCWRRKKNVCKPWEQLTYLIAVRRFMRTHMEDHEYDVCHTHFVIPTGEVAKWVKKTYHIPYIITAHGSDVEGHNRKKSMLIMHRLLRTGWKKIVDESYAVVSPSEYLMNLMKRNYANGMYYHIPNGINLKKYYAINMPEKKEKKILIMGRLQKFKNVQTVIEALSKLDLEEWTVDILGDGPYKEDLISLTKDLGLENKVSFRGWIDHSTSEQLDYIAKASIYVSASLFENCPMSVLETIAAGCYPLISDIPAHRQLLSGDDCFFKAEDSQELAVKIKKAMNETRHTMIEVSKYDWECVMPRYERLLEEMMEEYK